MQALIAFLLVLIFFGFVGGAFVKVFLLKRAVSKKPVDFQPTMGPWSNIEVSPETKVTQHTLRQQLNYPEFSSKKAVKLWMLAKFEELHKSTSALKLLVNDMVKSGAYPGNIQVLLSLELLQLIKDISAKEVVSSSSYSYSSSVSNKEAWRVVLKLPEHCTFDDVKDRYRVEIRKVHPDISSCPDLERARALNKAYREAKSYFSAKEKK